MGSIKDNFNRVKYKCLPGKVPNLTIKEIANNDQPNSTVVFRNVHNHSRDWETLNQTKIKIRELTDVQRIKFKENVMASIKREQSYENFYMTLLTTFVVAIVFATLGAAFSHVGVGVGGYVIMLVFILVITPFGLYDFERKSNIYTYKLVEYIESI